MHVYLVGQQLLRLRGNQQAVAQCPGGGQTCQRALGQHLVHILTMLLLHKHRHSPVNKPSEEHGRDRPKVHPLTSSCSTLSLSCRHSASCR